MIDLPGLDNKVDGLSGTLITVMLVTAFTCFIISEIVRNYSQVDKLWSIMPIIYSLITLISFPSPRTLIMSLLVCAWGLRLSFNFARKGGYSIIPWKGEEDYRWGIMRQQPVLKGRIRFGLFNLFFISLYQHFLILLFTSPLLFAAQNNSNPAGLLDIIAAILMLLFLVLETISDNQLFRFHLEKKRLKEPSGFYTESLKAGFMSDGLWKYSRHPNFVCEQAVWISFYLFGVAASGLWINWTISGSVLLVLLFQGSTLLTERISGSKYPEYSVYRQKVPKYFPRLIRKSGN